MRKRRPSRAAPAAAADGAGGEVAGGNPAAALTAAAALLSRRDYCSAQLGARLLEQGHPAAAVQAALAELRARRYLDDARYADRFVALRAGRGQGPLRVTRELADLGVDAAIIEAAIAAYDAEHGWAQLAAAVRRRRFGAAAPADWTQKARQARFLQYRGFSNDDIRSALGADAIADE